MTILVDDLRENVDRSLASGTTFLDLRKAFDSVHHFCFLAGIEDQELLWLQDYLFNRTEIVYFDGISSKPESITYGVSQGSILGLLLAIQINDIDTVLERAKVLLDADGIS